MHVNISANLFIIIATDVHNKLMLKTTTITSTMMALTEKREKNISYNFLGKVQVTVHDDF